MGRDWSSAWAPGLYDAVFSALGRIYGSDARGPMTNLTLFGGFASTICWPLSAFMIDHFGWRMACAAFATLASVSGVAITNGGRRARAERAVVDRCAVGARRPSAGGSAPIDKEGLIFASVAAGVFADRRHRRDRTS